MSYQTVVDNFMFFLKANGFNPQIEERSILAGVSNQKYPAVSINLPFFDYEYEELDRTDFFENQNNYDLSISKAYDLQDQQIVQITILLKNLYTEQYCATTEFPLILKKILKLKQEFLIN